VQNLANGLGSGEVVRLSIRLNIDGSGRASGVSVSGSSGRGSLDQAAVAAARGASPFPAPPDGRSRSFTVPLVLRTR
jgi:protein TonB